MLSKIQCPPERQTIRDEEIERTCRILRELEDLMAARITQQGKKS